MATPTALTRLPPKSTFNARFSGRAIVARLHVLGGDVFGESWGEWPVFERFDGKAIATGVCI